MALKIVPAAFEHLGSLRLLYQEMIAEEQAPYPEITSEDVDEFTRMMAQVMTPEPRPTFVLTLVAIQGHQSVGFLCAEIHWRRVGTPHVVGHVHQLYVTPRHRHRKVAEQLIDHAIRLAGEHPVPILTPTGYREVQVESVEVPALVGDDQWRRRGFEPYLVFHHMSLERAQAKLTRPRKRATRRTAVKREVA